MNVQTADLLLWRGRIGRRAYFLLGSLLIVVKFGVDYIVATKAFGRPWTPFRYLKPTEVIGGVTSLDPRDQWFFGTMALVALPFIWLGIALTLQRLRDSGLPLWMVVIFFMPMPINLIFFAVICCAGPKPKPGESAIADPYLDHIDNPPDKFTEALPKKSPARPLQGLYSLAIVLPVSLALVFFSVKSLGQYGWGVFLGMPFAGPMVTVILYGIPERRTFGQCVRISLYWVLAMIFLLLIVAFEGLFCLVMMLPIFIPLAIAGAVVGYTIQAIPKRKGEIMTMCLAVAALMPLLMGAEVAFRPPAPVFEARTYIDIDAPPEVVWKHVVSFSELPPPDDWLFQSGIAYPKHATISGRGAGAVRRCVFSTGAFVEPIEVWDEPRLLQFAVTECPPPMREFNPFYEIDPPHLQHFLVARRGSFRLHALQDGRTRLEGTTWYQHHMWPAGYWQAWSSPIIQRIHMQVLKHIKTLSEAESRSH